MRPTSVVSFALAGDENADPIARQCGKGLSVKHHVMLRAASEVHLLSLLNQDAN